MIDFQIDYQEALSFRARYGYGWAINWELSDEDYIVISSSVRCPVFNVYLYHDIRQNLKLTKIITKGANKNENCWIRSESL